MQIGDVLKADTSRVSIFIRIGVSRPCIKHSTSDAEYIGSDLQCVDCLLVEAKEVLSWP
jgi:hypothetical protein